MRWPVIIYFFILLAGICAYLINRKNISRGGTFFFFLLLGIFLTEGIGFYLVYSKSSNYYWPYHLFAPFSYLLFILGYQEQSFWTKHNTIIKGSIALFFVAAIVFSISRELYGPTSFITTISNILQIVVVIVYLNSVVVQNLRSNLLRQPVFWISVAYLIYCTGTFFTMAFLGYLKTNYPHLVKKYFIINYILSYLLYSFYIVGFLCSKTEKK